MQETLNMQGQVTLTLTDKNGHVVQERSYKNHIVKSGRRLVAELFTGEFSGTPPSKVTHIGIGSKETEPNDDDPDLLDPRLRKPIESVSYEEFLDSGIKRIRAKLTTVFDYNEANDPNKPLREAAIFNAAAAGVMYNRVSFEPVTKTDAFKLTLIWDIIF